MFACVVIMDIVEELKNLSRHDVEFDKKCSKLSHDINTGCLNVVQVVESLGPLLTDNSPNNRELGTWILSTIITEIDTNQLNTKQLDFIVKFYTDRLKDHHQVYAAVLQGILALIKFEHLPNGAVAQILTALFQNVACQQQQQPIRFVIYQIFEMLQNQRSDEIRSMGLDYVYGILSSIDGERDPKNLISLFGWYPKFVQIVQLGHLVEEAFETVACYFPVDFKAPPQDSNRITREDLAKALTPCLCAIPEFAEFAINLALEKLDSSLQIAKLDSLELLQYGCGIFEIDSYIQHASQIFSQIYKELLTNSSNDLEQACLKTLNSIVKKLSMNQQFCGSILKDICDTAKGNLLPDCKLFESSINLFLSLSTASDYSAKFIIKEIVPILTNSLTISKTEQKIQLLEILTNFLTINLKNYELTELKPVPLLCLKASLDPDPDFCRTGWECLTKIVEILPKDTRYSIYSNLLTILIKPQQLAIRTPILDCFERLASSYSDEIFVEIIEKIVVTDEVLQPYFEALSRLILLEKFRNFVIDSFIKHLNGNQAVVIANSLRNLLEMHQDSIEIHSVLFERNIIEIVIILAEKYENFDEQFYDNLAFIVKSVIGLQSQQQQEFVIETILPKIFDLKNIAFIVLLEAILCRLHQNIEIPYDRIFKDLPIFFTNSDPFIRNISNQLLANLLNKCTEDRLEIYLKQFEDYHESHLLLIWITKALIVRNHQLAFNYIDKLVKSLKIQPHLAEGFRILMDDSYDCLSRRSHCNRMLLYRQKFFIVITNKLVETYENDNGAYLIGFGYLLEHTPKIAILQQFPKIVTLMKLCLDSCNNFEILQILLQILLDFINDKQQCIEEHLDDFLVRFLKLSTYEASMKVRMLSLNCLEKIVTYPIYKLVKHKTLITNGLGKCLDDKKRLVRKAAVEARTKWFLLDAPI